MRWLTLLSFSLAIACAQQQEISVFNAASLVNSSNVAAGSLIAIQIFLQTGSGPISAIDPSTVSVNVQPSSAAIPVKLTVVSVSGGFGPVIALLPKNIALGTAQLTLFYNGLVSVAQISIVPTSFGLFTTGPGFGPALAQQVGGDRAIVLNQLTHPARPGEYVILWGTGLGSATLDQVSVMLGGKPAHVSYAGPAPGEPGLDQINFAVPQDASIPDGCYVALWVTVAGARSNSSSISKTNDGSVCQSTLGLTAADLATLDSGGNVGLARLSVSALIVAAPPAPLATATFVRIESANFIPLYMGTASVAQILRPVLAGDAFFGCSASPAARSLAGVFLSSGGPTDFGGKLILTGHDASLDLTSPGDFHFVYSGSQTSRAVWNPNQLPPPLFAPGTWMFAGSGGSGTSGSTVGSPFSEQLVLPPEIMATNFGALQTIDRQKDQTIAWNPAGFGANDVVTVSLTGNVNQEWFTGATTIACNAWATAGQVTMPSSLLESLSASPLAAPMRATIELLAAPKPGQEVQTFALPLSDGSSLRTVLQSHSSEIWQVAIH